MEGKGKLRLLLGALVGMALLVSGCGGGDSTTTLTRSQYIQQGNAICENKAEARKEKLQAAIAKASKNGAVSESEKEKLALEFVSNYEEMVAELKALPAPPNDEERIETMIKEMEKAAGEGGENPQIMIKSARYFNHPNELASEYGLTHCGL